MLLAQQNSKQQFSVSIDRNTVVKDTLGNRVSYADFSRLLATGTHTLDAKRDKGGKITHYLLRPLMAKDSTNRKTTIAQPQNEDIRHYKPGDTLPPFQLTTLDSSIIHRDQLRGKVVVLNFWFSSCRPCLYEMPQLDSLRSFYSTDTGIIFLAPNPEKAEDVRRFMEHNSFSYVLCPGAGKMILQLQVSIYPTHLVLDRNGKVVSEYLGGTPGIDALLRRDIELAKSK